MTVRHRILFLSIGTVVAGIIVTAWLLWPPTVITAENAGRIGIGMTLAEVESALGGAPRDESSGPLRAALEHDMEAGHDTRLVFAKSRAWVSDNTSFVSVAFRANPHLFSYPTRSHSSTPPATIRKSGWCDKTFNERHALYRDGSRCRNFRFRCRHSYMSCPSDTSITPHFLAARILLESNAYPRRWDSSRIPHK
jgi:hypothetical protein